jgi:nitrite reductase/ring-hydroxylating ferredoxin subunit
MICRRAGSSASAGTPLATETANTLRSPVAAAHLGADLAGGRIDENGCLVCPWHQSAYDVLTGRMVRGPQGIFAKVPGLGLAYQLLTAALPLGRAQVTEQNGGLYVG